MPFRRLRGYKAAVTVERFRAEAARLRIEEPDLYAQILSGAEGSDTQEAAAQDPDAYVALFLAELQERGVISPRPSEHAKRGFDGSEAGERTFADESRPLSGALYELDPHQYQLTGAQLLQATAQAVPDVAKQLHSQLISPFVDPKLADRYGKWLGDTFECGYVLCVSETWDELDPDTLRSLADEGLRRVIAEKDTRDPDLLIHDPEYRIRNVSYGIAGDMPYFAKLNDYLGEQPAFLRIGGFGRMILANVSSGGIKRRHASKLQSPLRMSFLLGVSIGLLDELSELPPKPPARLP